MDKAVIFSDELPRQTLSDMVRRGDATRLVTGVYTTETDRPPERVVRNHWHEIAGHLFPSAVITERSAQTASPVDGVLYLVHDRRDREVELPGLTISARRGAPPQADDISLGDGLYLASVARGLAENSKPSRSRSGKASRRLNRDELSEWVNHLAHGRDEHQLNQIRDRSRSLVPVLGIAEENWDSVSHMIGAALGTREATGLSRSLTARRAGRPFDPGRVRTFDKLASALRASSPQSRSARFGTTHLPFYEAYFSNFIEGTEFTVDEAEEIIYEHQIPQDRPDDAHDILGTFQIVDDTVEMSRLATSPEEFMELLRARHAVVMAGRPGKSPGKFKTRANQVGNTVFVDPELVEGTLVEGFERLSRVDTAWERSVLSMFVVSEVHPFADGNGRLARITMNTELVAAGLSRTIVPVVFRDDYLGSLRRLSRSDEPSALIKAMRYANDWTAQINFSDFNEARSQMTALNAFEPSDEARLLMPVGTSEEPSEVALLDLDQSATVMPSRGDVSPYRRKDGTFVRGHQRRPRRDGRI